MCLDFNVPSLGGIGAPLHTTWACGPLSLLAWQQRAGDLSTCTSTVLFPLLFFCLYFPTSLAEVGALADERKAFLGMGFTFMTASAFTLAKTMRDLQEANSVKHLVDAGIIKTRMPPLASPLLPWRGQLTAALCCDVQRVGRRWARRSCPALEAAPGGCCIRGWRLAPRSR